MYYYRSMGYIVCLLSSILRHPASTTTIQLLLYRNVCVILKCLLKSIETIKKAASVCHRQSEAGTARHRGNLASKQNWTLKVEEE